MHRTRTLVSLAAAGVFAGLAAGSAPTFFDNYSEMNNRALRAEVPANVDGIKTAELAYDAAFDEFVEIPRPTPRAIDDLDEQFVDWSSGTDFDTLGWAPDGQVRSTYWVEVKADGRDYVVHGMIDADGDGVPAHYTATRSINALQLTPNDVY